jgi:hypothetical protein
MKEPLEKLSQHSNRIVSAAASGALLLLAAANPNPGFEHFYAECLFYCCPNVKGCVGMPESLRATGRASGFRLR